MSEAKQLIKTLAAAEAELHTLDQEADAYREALAKVEELRHMKRKMETCY